MKLHVMQNDTILNTYELPIFGSDSTDEKILSKLRKLWRDTCTFRDKADCHIIFKVKGEVDAQVRDAVAIGMNIAEFSKTIAYYANAYVPKTEGGLAIQRIFEQNDLSWARTLETIQEQGGVKAYLPSQYGMFSFHFYEPMEWVKYDLNVIASACSFVPFDVQDYSQICKAIYQCPKGARPMVWLNPYLAGAFIEASGAQITMTQMQAYVSSFIIVAAIESEGQVDDSLVNQLWESLRWYCEEDGDHEMLADIYGSAERLLQSRK